MNTGLKPVWAGCNMRLDPRRLPQAACHASSDDYGEVSYTIDQRGAVIRRKLEMSGLPVTIMMPAAAFSGVAARAIEDAEGNVTVTLELLHEDPMLCVPLLGEELHAREVAGMCVIALGLLLVDGRIFRRRRVIPTP